MTRGVAQMLISCPGCHMKVSDKAHACPHCGFRIDALLKCPECGRLVPPETTACPSCGYPFANRSTPSVDTLKATVRPECGGTLYDTDAACPHCGAPVPASDHAGKEPGESLGPESSMQGVPAAARRVEADIESNVPSKPITALPPASSKSAAVPDSPVNMQRPTTARINRGAKCVWYYVLNGLVYGPASANEVYGRIVDGRLPPDVLVWTDGFPGWARASDYVIFGSEGPDAADVMQADGMPASDSRPQMMSTDDTVTYRYSADPDTTAPGTYFSAIDGPHPWVRYFARIFDLYIFVSIIALVSGLLGLGGVLFSNAMLAGIVWTMEGIILWIPLESLWLWLCGTTPGKWLLGVSVRSVNGRKLSFGRACQRSALVATEGWVLGIPVLYLVGLIRGYKILNRTTSTPWDLEAGTTVHHRDLPVWGVLIYLAVGAAYVYLYYLGTRAAR